MNELQQDLASLEKTQKAYQQAAEKMAGLYAKLSRKIQEPGESCPAAMKQLLDMNQSFNLQYLGLQQVMQDESRRFTLVSNIMKTKHDTAKNSISNLR